MVDVQERSLLEQISEPKGHNEAKRRGWLASAVTGHEREIMNTENAEMSAPVHGIVILRLHLKREYWEAIRDGSKPEEYRLATPYWSKRLAGRTYDEIHLMMGYPKRGDESRILKRKWTGVKTKEITHPHFGNETCMVYAIDVTELAG
jgi:hypothetical protein